MKPTLIAACNDLAISTSWSSLGLLPRISGSQYWPMAPFMWAILPCDAAGALTHCDGSRPTPQTMYAWVRVLGVRWFGLMLSVDGKGWVIREWREDVRLGMMSEWSPWSLVDDTGRSWVVEPGLSLVWGRFQGLSRREGPMVLSTSRQLRLGELSRSRSMGWAVRVFNLGTA